MRAAVFDAHGDAKVIRIAEVANPMPGRGEVRVAVHAVALNHLDIWVRRGLPGLTLSYPHIGGADVSGEVDLLGDGVEGWLPGAEVLVNPSLPCGRCPRCRAGDTSLCRSFRILGEHVGGGMADYVVVPADRLHAKPERLSHVEAAATPLVYQTAWRAVITRARVVPGETVVVLGAGGGVGSAVLQVARLAGARVIAVTSTPERCAAVAGLGADMVIDRLQEPWSRAAWLATDRRGADVIVENVGAATWRDSLRTAARGGRIVTYGATTGATAETDIRYIFWKQLTILGTTMASDREFEQVMQLVTRGALQPVVGAAMSLERAAEAHELLEAGTVVGKVVLEVR